MKILICAGEASGDLHASHLIHALRTRHPEVQITHLGGDLMARAAGTAPLVHISDMAYMGFSEVLRHLPQIRANMARAHRALDERPDMFVAVDYPGFNLGLVERAHRAGIPVAWFIPPKVWAWKQWRVRKLRRYVDLLLSILPFEQQFYTRHGLADRYHYVGNPSVAEVDARLQTMEARRDFNYRHDITGRPLLALLPGSRLGEIRCNLPIMATAVQQYRDYQAVVAAAPGIPLSYYRRFTRLPVVEDDTFALLAHAEAALVTSGTATLEAALAGTPQVVCYRANGSRLSYAIMERLLSVDHVSLPNLIAGAPAVPEMLVHRCTPRAVADALAQILPGTPGRDAQLAAYADIRRRLGNNDAATTAADIILNHLTPA